MRLLLGLMRQGRWPEISYQASHYRYLLFWLLAVFSLVLPWWQEWIERFPPVSHIPTAAVSRHIYAGQPVATAYPNPLRVFERAGYTVGYDETRHNPAWVAYYVPAGAAGTAPERPEHFDTDPATRSRVSSQDYSGSGFDRGHLAPNYAIATRYGEQAQRETFLMSNIVPQRPALNRGPWRELEMLEAGRGGLANRLDGVWVMTGPVYDGDRQTLRHGIEVPDAFYKIVVDEVGGYPRVLGFVMPQDVDKNATPSRYLTSVDEIERLTDLDFLSPLDDTLEEKIEAETMRSIW